MRDIADAVKCIKGGCRACAIGVGDRGLIAVGIVAEELAGCDQTELQAGEVVTVITPNGGGYGEVGGE